MPGDDNGGECLETLHPPSDTVSHNPALCQAAARTRFRNHPRLCEHVATVPPMAKTKPAPTSETLSNLIGIGVILQIFGGVVAGAAWPGTETKAVECGAFADPGCKPTQTVDTGNAFVTWLGLGVVGLAGILVLIGAVGWGVLIALRVRDASVGK